jgi:hypothetical protein
MYIQASLSAIAAVALLIWRNDVLDWLEQEGAPLTDGGLTATVIGEAIAAALLFVAAAGLMRGSSGWRLVVAIVQGVAMGFAVYTLVAHHVGGFVYRSVFTLFVGVFVLWALYGNEQSDRFFEEHG